MYVCKYLCLPSSGAWKIVKQIYFQNLKNFFFFGFRRIACTTHKRSNKFLRVTVVGNFLQQLAGRVWERAVPVVTRYTLFRGTFPSEYYFFCALT